MVRTPLGLCLNVRQMAEEQRHRVVQHCGISSLAAEKGAYAKTVNGDAFSKEIKDKAIELIKKDLGKVDLVVYSLAAPRRTDLKENTGPTSP